MAGLSLKERMELSPEEKKRRYQQAVKPFIEKNFKNGVVSAENYIGANNSPTAGLTKENFARSTEGYAQNTDGTYRYRATRALGIADQIDQNPEYAAKDRMQYYLLDNPNAFNTEAKTANDYWANIYQIMATDSEKGRQLAEQAKYFSTQPGNPLYNPYQSATVTDDLKALFGMDSFSSQWMAENRSLLDNLERKSNGDVKAPSSASTAEQILAYNYYQLLEIEGDTLKAEEELADLKTQISSAVAQSKLIGANKTADEIYKDLNLSQYSTLKSMSSKKDSGTPYQLTRAVNYSDDMVYAMIQAAIDKNDSDISGMTDFTAAGAKYSNLQKNQRMEAKYQEFLAEEQERYDKERAAMTNTESQKDTNLPDILAITNKYDSMQAQDSKFAFDSTGDVQRIEGKSVAQRPIASLNNPAAVQNTIQRKNTDDKLDSIRNLDSKAVEKEIATLETRLENVDSDENALPMEEYTNIEKQIATLKSELRQHNNLVKLDEYAAMTENADFKEYASRGANMENASAAHEQYSDTFADPRAPQTALTEDEISVYNYLLAKEGEDAADEYIAAMQETVNARQGQAVASELEGKPLEQLLYSYNTGVLSAFEGIGSAFTDTVRPTAGYQYANQAMRENNGFVQNLINDMASSLGNMTPSILLSAATGGLGASAALSSGVGAVTMGVSASGNAYNEVMKSGNYSPEQARAYSMLVGCSEAFLSYALGGISKLGNNQLLQTAIQAINRIDNVFLRAASKVGANMISEAGEEYLQAQIEPLLQNWILGMENDINVFSEDALYSALMGTLTAGLLEGGSSAMGAAADVRNERTIGQGIVESGKRDQLIAAAKQSDNTQVRRAAEAIEAGTLRGTEGNIGQLAIEYHDAGGDTGFLFEPTAPAVMPTVTGVTTDYDSAQALSRAMRGEATENDLDLLEKGVSIPNHEEVVSVVNAAASEFKAVNERYENKQDQLVQLKRDVDTAQGKVDSANNALSMHLSGVVRIQNEESVGNELIVKHQLESQIQQIRAEAQQLTAAGIEPEAQNRELAALEQQLAESQKKIDELSAGGREITAFQGQVVNAQKSLDAANRNYAVAEMEMESLNYEYLKASRDFRETVSNAVNRAFGENALGMLESTKNAQVESLADAAPPPEEDMTGFDEVEAVLNAENAAEEIGMAEMEKDFEDSGSLVPEDIADDVKADLRGRRINLTDTQRNEIDSIIGGYGDFRGNMMGKITIANDGTSLDSVWGELSDAFPAVFPAGASEGDQVRVLANVLNELYPNTDRSGGVQYSAVNHVLPRNNNAGQTSRNNRNVKTAQMIIREASSNLDIPIRTGIEASTEGIPPQARAYYSQQAAAARVPGDIANVAHEIGHALDDRHGFTRNNPDVAQRLINNLSPEYSSIYPAQDLPGEAVADMIYTYIAYGEDAAIAYGGDAYHAFMNGLSRSERRALRTMQADVNRYRNQTADEIGTKAVTQTKKDTDLRNASSKVRDAVRKANYTLLDNLDPAIRLDRLAAQAQENGFLAQDKHAETAFATARRAEAIASAQLTQAMSDHTGRIIGDSFADCLEGVSADRMVDLSKYLAYVRALDWMDQGRVALDPAITYDDMTTFCLEQQGTEVETAARRIWAWYKQFTQAWYVDTGRMSQTEFDRMWAAEPHYVPFRRVIDRKGSNGSNFAQGIEQLDTGIHGVESNGSQRDIFDPLTSIMQSVANVTESTLRNEVGKTILWQVRNSDNLGGMVTEVPASQMRQNMIETALTTDDGFETLEQLYDNPLARPDGTNIFGVVDDGGQRSYIQVNDPLLLALMQNPNPKNTSQFLQAMAKVTRAVNATVTTLSGTFATRNLPSDAGSAWRASPETNPVRFFADMVTSFADVARRSGHSNEYLEWAAMGGLGDDVYASAGLTGESARKVSTRYLGTRPSNLKEWSQQVGDAIGQMATALSALSENTTRLALYKEGKRAALRDQQSEASARSAGAALSRMGTTDFNRSGAKTAGISTLFRFAEATINGNVQAARTLLDRSTDVTSNAGLIKGRKAAVNIILRAAVLAAGCMFFMDDEEKEQFRRMDPAAKYSGLVIPWANVSGVEGDLKVIPYPKDAVSDLMNIGAALADGMINGGVWDDLKGLVDNVAESLFPFGSFILSPIFQAEKNKTWYDGSIIPSHLEDKAYGVLQYDEDTSAIARLTSNALYNITGGEADVSPMLVDYVLEQYGGGIYDTAVGIEEFITSIANGDNAGRAAARGLRQMVNAIRDGFTRNSITTSDVSGIYYDGVNFVDGIVSTIKDGVIPPDLAQGMSQDEINKAYTAAENLSKNMDTLNEAISSLYDEMDNVMSDTSINPADQEREISEIRKEIYDLQLSGTALVDNYKLQYCGDAKSSMISPRVEYAEARGYYAFNNESLPESFRNQQDSAVVTKLRDFYEQDTSKTSFKPTYPPDFVDGDNVITAWDDVDSQTKQAMEEAWTYTYISELTANGFRTVTDYDKAKEINAAAKRKATASAKEIYSLKYGFRE